MNVMRRDKSAYEMTIGCVLSCTLENTLYFEVVNSYSEQKNGGANLHVVPATLNKPMSPSDLRINIPPYVLRVKDAYPIGTNTNKRQLHIVYLHTLQIAQSV